ncbi:hypothetical protein BH10ACT3_BH10ACT3_16930 [soil metagenome]
MSVSEQFGDGAQLVDQLGQMISKDGLADLLAGFNDAGEESKVESWVTDEANRPTEESAVKRAVGRTRIEGIAGQLGVSADDVAEGLARIIPAAVNALTPGGRLPSGEQLDRLDLGSLLGDVDVAELLR